jgi:glutamate carboxypeptidase
MSTPHSLQGTLMDHAALSQLQQRVCQLIAQRAGFLLEDLRWHVQMPTGRNHSAGLDATREHFAQRCKALGASVELVPGDARAEWLAGPSSRRGGAGAITHVPPTMVCRRVGDGHDAAVLLSGHLDTVHDPAGDFRELSISPDRKTATGPGVVDMKGGLVIAMAALEALAEAGVSVPWGFIFNSDEETGSFHSATALHQEGASGRYAYGLALEPAAGRDGLVTQRGGSGQFMIECFGKAAHVGRDFASGISAVNVLCETILKAGKLSDISAGTTVNIGPLLCDQPTNQVADHAAAWGNVRFKDTLAAARLEAGLAALERGDATLKHASPELPVVMIPRLFSRPAKPQTEQTLALAEVIKTAAAALGQPIRYTSTAGVCDGNNLQHAGLPTLDTLGVRGGGLHTPQEWIELESLVERCQLLAVVMMRLTHAG